MASKVTLRPIEPEDLDLLYTIENDTELWQVGTTSVPYSRFILHQYLANSTADIYTDKQVRLVIENEQGQTVGLIDAMNFDPRHARAEVGVVIMAPFRRQGYSLSALNALENIAKNWNIHQLYAIISADNVAGLSTFTKASFSETATLKDWICKEGRYIDALLFQKTLC